MDKLNAVFQESCGAIQNPMTSVASSLLTGPQPVEGFTEAFPEELADHFEDAWESAEAEEPHYDKAWIEAAPQQQTPAVPLVREQFADPDEFTAFWQELWPLAEAKEPEYHFENPNPFLQVPDAYTPGVEFAQQGDCKQAMLALEAEVVRHSENSDAWRLLGQLNAENNEDNRAIFALMKGHEADPYNLDTLLALGISLINQDDGQAALEYLKTWLQSNPEYHGLTALAEDPFEHVLELFAQAAQTNPFDADVFQVLGSLHFLNRDYAAAAQAFESALELRPEDYAIWNRLGAAYANQNENLQAVTAYSKALEGRPAYARAWANLGIAHASMNDMLSAARLYLCALALNPCATQVWTYLVTAFVCMGRFDLAKKVQYFDVNLFRDEFEIIQYEQLVSADWAREFTNSE